MGKNKFYRENANAKPVDPAEEILENVETTETEGPIDCTVETQFLNMRKAPSIDGDIVKVLPKGTQIVCVPENDSWYAVYENNEVVGYVMNKYLTEK